MASINGMTIKNIEQFYGSRGECFYRGDVYIGDEKLGFWSQDTGGGDDFQFDTERAEKVVDECIEYFVNMLQIWRRNAGLGVRTYRIMGLLSWTVRPCIHKRGAAVYIRISVLSKEEKGFHEPQRSIQAYHIDGRLYFDIAKINQIYFVIII